jgi:hypothetical protein
VQDLSVVEQTAHARLASAIRRSMPETPRWIAARLKTWIAVDWALASYVGYVAAIAVIFSVPHWRWILLGHSALVLLILSLPERGAGWEAPRDDDPGWRAAVRSIARFLRYTYPPLLLTPFFEEVALTVNAAATHAPYWFEHDLYTADHVLFGASPAVILSQAGGPAPDEVMHAFYFSYFIVIIGGTIFAFNGGDATAAGPGRDSTRR